MRRRQVPEGMRGPVATEGWFAVTIDRVDRAERRYAACPQSLYRALLDPALLEKWLPPEGMSGKIHQFSAIAGEGYVMSLYYEDAGSAAAGKTTASEDRFQVVFERLNPPHQIVQNVVFDSADPAFAGVMRQSWTIVADGPMTRLAVACENVPPGIRPEDHRIGLNSSLEKLAMVLGADK